MVEKIRSRSGTLVLYVCVVCQIREATNLCLTDRRLQKFKKLGVPIRTRDFTSALAKTIYTYKDDHIAFQQFTADVSGRAKWIELNKQKELEEAEGDGGKKKDGKKGKKK